jgi:protein arginine N-methyltransferase 1
MYSIYDYGRFVVDPGRIQTYVRAVRQAVQPGCVVVDLGAGTGFFSLLACQLGARRVYAIEPDNSILVAHQLARANGYEDRIVFLQDVSTRVSLPERADVIVSDLRGILPLFQRHISSIVDARQRFLAPGGTLIPQRDTLWAAPVEAPDAYRRLTEAWEDNGWGIDLRAGRHFVTNVWRKERVQPEQFLAQPQCWTTLDYAAMEDDPNASGDVTWTAEHGGTGHGIIVWFDATLAEGVGFSNAPGAPELIYGNAFFPWTEPVSLSAGDSISVKLQANLVGEDYVWLWDTSVLEQGDPRKIRADFRQSTFFGAPLSPEQLRRLASDHVPYLNLEGKIDGLVLSLMNGQSSLEEIARRVAEQFPERFTGWTDALTRVGELSQKYGR